MSLTDEQRSRMNELIEARRERSKEHAILRLKAEMKAEIVDFAQKYEFADKGVGAYDSRTDSVAPFSGRGFTAWTSQAKPDLAAPGVNIMSASPGGGYVMRSGTSMAAPFITGSAALLMQYGIVEGRDSFLYGEKLKAYLLRGSRKIPALAEYPNPQVGWGVLCVRDSLPG